MANVIEPHKIKIETITPVHIGAGHKVKQWEYIESKDLSKIFVIRETIYDVLTPDQRRRLLIIMKGKKVTPHLLSNFFMELNDKSKERISKYIIYNKYRINLNKREIFAHIKSINSKPYIPGSSIKGAIKTFMLYQLYKNLNKSIKNKIEQKILDKLKSLRKKSRKKLGQVLHDAFFKYIYPKVQRDFLYLSRSLGFRDSTEIDHTVLYDMVLIDHPSHNKSLDRRYPIEVIDKENILHSGLFFQYKPETLSKIDLFMKKNNQIVHKHIYNYNAPVTNFNLSNPIIKLDWNFLRFTVISTITDLINNEINFMTSIKNIDEQYYNTAYKSIVDFYHDLEKIIQNLKQNELILRIGFASGFRFTTITFLLSQTIRDSIISMFSKLVPPANANKILFPISRRFVSNRIKFQPLGWIKITKI